MPTLPLFLDLAIHPVLLVGEGPAADAKRRLVERLGGRIARDGEDARIAIVALEEEAEALAAVARLRADGLLVNAVDRPALCDFTLPAIVDRRPVLVAIGTGGVSAGLAAALRQRLEALLPAGLGRLAEALHAARPRLRARHPEASARRRAIGALLAPGGALDPLREQPDPVAALDAGEVVAPARIERVAVASPDPDELTLRAARLLAAADRLYHPTDMAPAILARARADAAHIAGTPPSPAPSGLSVVLAWTRA